VRASHGTPTVSYGRTRGHDAPGHLVPRRHGKLRVRQLAVDDVQIRATDAGREHFEKNLTVARRRHWHRLAL
jgi:hypothetical protein